MARRMIVQDFDLLEDNEHDTPTIERMRAPKESQHRRQKNAAQRQTEKRKHRRLTTR